MFFSYLACMSTCYWGLQKTKYEPFITHNRGTLKKKIFSEFTMKQMCFIREVTEFLWQVGFSLRHISLIPMVSVNGVIECLAQIWLKFNNVEAIMWLVIKAHMIQVDCMMSLIVSNTDSLNIQILRQSLV